MSFPSLSDVGGFLDSGTGQTLLGIAADSVKPKTKIVNHQTSAPSQPQQVIQTPDRIIEAVPNAVTFSVGGLMVLVVSIFTFKALK